IAEEPPQGPVFLAVTMDALDAEAEMDIEPTVYTPWRVRAEPSALLKAAEVIGQSSRPLIIAGDGVALCNAQAELCALGEQLAAAMYECNTADFNIPHSHPLYLG